MKRWSLLSSTNVKWLDAREAFFYESTRKGIDMARECVDDEEEAAWLCSVTPMHDWSGRSWRDAFLSLPVQDARTMCYAALITPGIDLRLLKQAADLGFPYAQAMHATLNSYPDNVEYYTNAAKNGDRYALFLIGLDCRYGPTDGKEKDACLKRSAELGCPDAFYSHGLYNFPRHDPLRYTWFWKSIQCGQHVPEILDRMAEVCICLRTNDECHDRDDMGPAVYTIGSYLRKEPQSNHDLIFAVEYYKQQTLRLRAAINTWTWVARRVGVVKDIRRLIANMLWTDKFQFCEGRGGGVARKRIKL